jgi:OFA family oxalate/formate antiporter-like MFS transporter
MIGKDVAAMATTIPRTFFVLSGVFLVGVVGAAQLYATPTQGWKPAGWNPVAGKKATVELAPAEVLRTWRFYVLWALYFVGTSVGLTAIGEASPLLREAAKSGAFLTAGAGLGVMSVFNGVGRLAWGSVSDRFGRFPALAGMCGVSALTCALVLRSVDGFGALLFGLCLVAFAYGGFLALMPAMTADLFGPKHVGANYGMLFSAWGVCGFVAPGYFAGLLDAARKQNHLAEGYAEVFGVLALLALAGGGLAVLLRERPQEPHLSVTTRGRSGTIHYRDHRASFSMHWEFGGLNTLAVISIPSPDQWAARTRIPLEERESVLRFIAEQVIQAKTNGNHRYEITDDWLNILE